MATLPVDYEDASTPTGAKTELPATTTRGLNAITAQINTNTVQINVLNCATIADLKALTAIAQGHVTVLGYYATGDGGGGVFRYDASDTTTADNGGTVLTSTGGLTGRWKRVYEGEVNARWFGMNPSQSDNTAALQAAVNWVSTDATRDTGGGGFKGGTVFIPIGYYRFYFTAGSSGLSTITIPAPPSAPVTIRGEGYSTVLTVRGHTAVSNELAYFFTFDGGGYQGNGGGIKDLTIDANEGQLTWGIYLPTWHAAEFSGIRCWDIHGGVLDAESNLSGYNGEAVIVRDIDLLSASGSNHIAQYGVRFRAGHASNTGAWSDCWINDCIFTAWDSAVLLDGVLRFTVFHIVASNNVTTSNTIGGTSKAGMLQAVKITTTYDNAETHATGWHLIDGIYYECHPGTQTAATNAAVLIEIPADFTGYIRGCRILNVRTDGNSLDDPTNHLGFLRLSDLKGDGNLMDTSFAGNMMGFAGTYTDVVSVGPTVGDTYLDFQPNWVTLNAPGATPTICADLYKQINFTGMAAAITSLTTGATPGRHDGQKLRIRFKDDGSPRNITPGVSFRAVGATLPAATTGSKTMYWDCVWNRADTVWDVVDVKLEA